MSLWNGTIILALFCCSVNSHIFCRNPGALLNHIRVEAFRSFFSSKQFWWHLLHWMQPYFCSLINSEQTQIYVNVISRLSVLFICKFYTNQYTFIIMFTIHNREYLSYRLTRIFGQDKILAFFLWLLLKGGPGASGRVLPPVTGRSRVRVVVSSHCTSEGKTCHWHPSPDPAQSGSSLHWVRHFFCGSHYNAWAFTNISIRLKVMGQSKIVRDGHQLIRRLGNNWWNTAGFEFFDIGRVYKIFIFLKRCGS